MKEELGKTTCPPRKYVCENELRRPLPAVPNGKTEKNKKKQGRKHQNMRRENKVHLAGLFEWKGCSISVLGRR